MAQVYQADELDTATREYLRTARSTQGVGMPGVYLAKSDGNSVLFLVIAFFTSIITFLATFPPTGDPLKTAMLQTAGGMVTLWLIYAGVRGLLGRGSILGHFHYIDPLFLWNVEGDSVTVAPLGAPITAAQSNQNMSNGAFQNADILVEWPSGGLTFQTEDQAGAQRAVLFLTMLARVQAGGQYSPRGELPPVWLGVAAREAAETGTFPADLSNCPLIVSTIPAPQRFGRASSGMVLPLVFVLVVGALGLSVLPAMNAAARDEALYAELKDGPPPKLREYLIDPRNQLHRAELQERLNAVYDQAIAALRKKPNRPAKLIEGWAGVLEVMKTLPQPIASIGFLPGPGTDLIGNADAQSAVLTDLTDRLAQDLGPELIAFAPPADPAKGMVRIAVEAPLAGRPGPVKWTITLQPSPAAAAAVVTAQTKTVPENLESWRSAAAMAFSLPETPAPATTPPGDLRPLTP